MPPLLCPSPEVLDYTFPRTNKDLKRVAIALGEMQRMAEEGLIHIAFTTQYAQFVENFAWEEQREYPLILDVHRYLSLLFLQPHPCVILIQVRPTAAPYTHPIPDTSLENDLVGYWAEETGRLYIAHERLTRSQECFIAVACSRAMSGEGTGRYVPNNKPAFPLVGRDGIQKLADAYTWDIPTNARNHLVTVAEAKRNCKVIGAEQVLQPKGDSHMKVVFPGCRPWTLDVNTDPVPERFLRQLCALAHLPYEVIVAALTSGVMPPRTLKLSLPIS